MLKAIILICSALLPDCTRANAVDVLVSPPLSVLPTTCFLQGQAYAGEHLTIRPGDTVKIACVRG